MLTAYLARRTVALAARGVLAVAPGGGQRRARRNAWAAMSDAGARARGRREAEAALALAQARAAQPATTGAALAR
jgi:hypothetical protein